MFESLQRIATLIRKELLAVFKDPRSRTILFLPPMMQCLLFGYAASYDLNDVPYAVLNQEHSAASQAFLAGLDGSNVFRRTAELRSTSEIADYINDKRALLVLVIERDFERRLFAGEPAKIQVIADSRNSNTAGIATAYVSSVAAAFSTQWRQAHGKAGPPLELVIRAWYNPNLETRWHMVPSLIGTLTMLSTLLLTALSVAREREQGTFDQLLVTPFRPAEIMAGKAVPSMLVGLGQASTILLVAQLWFHIPFAGSFLTLYAGLSVFLMAAVGMGLFVSAFSQTMQQAMLYAFVLIMPCTLLSGLTTPISNMPQILQAATAVNPLRYAIEIAQRVYLEGASLDTLTAELWPLAIIGVLTLSSSAWLFRHKLT